MFSKKSALTTMSTVIIVLMISCKQKHEKQDEVTFKHQLIFDTDANNEVDDQHALAYLLYSGDHFAVEGITVNATSSYTGSPTTSVSGHYDEAKRVMKLCGVWGKIPLFTGADASFDSIKGNISHPHFDGHEAVDFIIEQAMREREQKLVILAVGKLTNVALALLKEPRIAERVRVVWLGSNYPKPGEHNQSWDESSMNYVLDTDVPFEMVTVRLGEESGTNAVIVTQAQIIRRMPGIGPRIETPIVGRHGGNFYTWGDYSADLFSNYRMWHDPKGRALFDVAAVAILKNPEWAQPYQHPAPIYIDGVWVERPDNPRKITIWEWFDNYAILNDFFVTMDNYVIAQRP